MSKQSNCLTCAKPCTQDSCGTLGLRCPEPPPCTTCVQRLYDVITYTNVTEKEFNVIINDRHLPIQGFILAFVDEWCNPIQFDDCNSFMKIESITPYPDENCFQHPPTYNYYVGEICPFADKIYYTYTIQEANCMPINPALWSYYINIKVPLKLSFKLDHNYTGNVFLYINMFYLQKQFEYKLEPIIANSVHSDQEDGCVAHPNSCGYVSWMINLQETPPPTSDYPYNY